MDLEDIAEKPMSVKLGMVVGVVVLVIILGYMLIIKTHVEQWNHLKTQELALKQQMEKRKFQAPDIQAYKNQLQLLKETFKTMLKQLPSANEMKDVLEELTKTGLGCGLKFDFFIPQPEITHDFYTELPIKISVSGNYEHLATFISRVAEIKRVINFQELSIERDTSSTSVEGELVMTILAKIYSYKSADLD